MTHKTAALRTGTAITLLLLLNPVVGAGARMTPTNIDIFTTADQAIHNMETVVSEHPRVDIRQYTLGAIRGLEEELSLGLPLDPDKAKRLALKRLRRMSKAARSQLQHAATSLATATQYGLEKYPAIVFDGELIVYGLTDLSIALVQYRQWRAGETR